MSNLVLTKFYKYEEMKKLLFDMEHAYPDKMRISSLTKTPEGREVYLVTLADFTLGENAEKRGAYFVQAGLHAQEVSGPVAAMAVIERILTETPEILHSTVFYIVPNINPDGMELALSANFRGVRSKYKKIPNLPNALIPADINGDGKILRMRRENPLGKMKELDGYPGIMAKRGPGETEGRFYDVWFEGLIENYDGGEPVLGIERLDFNRCYPSRWESDLGGELPLYPPEMRAVTEFEVAHKNIFAGVDFHNGSAAILSPLYPNSNQPQKDIQLINKIAAIASEMTGLSHISTASYGTRKSHMPHGTSVVWNYNGLGRSHFLFELGLGLNAIGMSTEEIKSHLETEDDLEVLSIKHLFTNKEYWDKYASEIVEPWRPFDHPQLGKVEIGGLRGGNASFFFGDYIGKLIPRVTDFILLHASMTPKLIIGNAESEKIADGVYRVRASLLNAGGLGTTVMQGGGKANSQTPVSVTISSEHIEVVSVPAIYWLEQLDSEEKVSFEWFIKAAEGTEIKLCAEHPKSESPCVTLKL